MKHTWSAAKGVAICKQCGTSREPVGIRYRYTEPSGKSDVGLVPPCQPLALSPDGTELGVWTKKGWPVEGAAPEAEANGYDAGYADGYADGKAQTEHRSDSLPAGAPAVGSRPATECPHGVPDPKDCVWCDNFPQARDFL